MAFELTKERIEFLKNNFSYGFVAFCGFEAVHVAPGQLESRLEISDNHRQQDGFVHAGVMATMADHTAGYAAYTLIPEDQRILTVEFKINFLRPAYSQALVCRAQVIKPGRKVLIVEASVYDQRPEGEVMTAKVLATMASVPVRDLTRK